MRTYTLSELSMLADLRRHVIIEILHNNGISINEQSDDAVVSDEALQAVFCHLGAKSKADDVHKLFDEESDNALRKQILTYHISDLMNDRERARLLNLPRGCRIRERAKIIAPENFVCGENIWIGEGAILDASGGLEIGDNTQVGLSVMIWTHSSHSQAVSGNTGSETKEGIERSPTKIGMNCFIAGPSVVGPGVTIGDRVIIPPLTFISRDVESDSVVNPHREFREMQDRIADLERKIVQLQELYRK